MRWSRLVCLFCVIGLAFAEEGHDKFDGNQADKSGSQIELDGDLLAAESQDVAEHKSYPQHQSQYEGGQSGASAPPNAHNKQNTYKHAPTGEGVAVPVPLPMASRPGHVALPNSPPLSQKGHGHPGHGPPQGLHGGPAGYGPPPPSGPQPVYPGPQQQVYPVETNQIEYGPDPNQNQGQQQFPGYSNGANTNDPWPLPMPEMPKIVNLDVKCEKNLMKVAIEFDKPFNGIIFSKGHYSYGNCVHLPAGSGRNSVYFDVSINSCGTTGNTQNGLYGFGGTSGSGTFFENTVVVQYDAQVQEVWDQARKLRCTWHDQYEKAVTFRPFPVDMLDVVRADFAGDNVGCWMQIQVGKGPWASEVAGIVKIGQTMTMVLAIKDEENKFDMLVRNCIAHDGKRAPIELVDSHGCISRPKLMSRFTKIKNFGSSATVLSYAHFQAFKFPDSMEVHFQCTIQICRYQCPEQCSQGNQPLDSGYEPQGGYASPPQQIQTGYGHSVGKPREERDLTAQLEEAARNAYSVQDLATEVGLNRIIQVVSTGDLAFSLAANESLPVLQQERVDSDIICMSTLGFAASLVVLIAILIISCLISVFLCLRQRSLLLSCKTTGVTFAAQDLRTFPRKPHLPPATIIKR